LREMREDGSFNEILAQWYNGEEIDSPTRNKSRV